MISIQNLILPLLVELCLVPKSIPACSLFLCLHLRILVLNDGASNSLTVFYMLFLLECRFVWLNSRKYFVNILSRTYRAREACVRFDRYPYMGMCYGHFFFTCMVKVILVSSNVCTSTAFVKCLHCVRARWENSNLRTWYGYPPIKVKNHNETQ